MYEPKVAITKVLGECTSDPPMKLGDYLAVRDDGIRIPEGALSCRPKANIRSRISCTEVAAGICVWHSACWFAQSRYSPHR